MKSSKVAYVVSLFSFVLVLVMAAQPLHAQSEANFYAGKTITVLVGSSAGGGTDVTARVLARHLERYIPGKPRIRYH